jgi:TatD DNase family protein
LPDEIERSTVQMFDSHCHLQTEQFADDVDATVALSRAAGVSAFMIPAIDLASFDATVALANRIDGACYALGIHPHSSMEWSPDVRKQILDRAETDSKLVAIGEIGLDYFYDFSPKDIQQKAFREQIELAQELGKPIIIHTRESDDDVWQIVSELYPNNPQTGPTGQFHCFSGSVDLMQKAVTKGFFVSFTGNITFKRMGGEPNPLPEVVRQTPIENILLETDSPYLAPMPHRGKRNTPANLGLIAAKIAEIKEIDISIVMKQTFDNATRLFLRPTLIVMLFGILALFASASEAQRQDPIGSRPPDSVMTPERRRAEDLLKKQREELQKEDDRRRQDSVVAAEKERQETILELQQQARQDSAKAAQRIADEEKARLKALTPIAWKAIGIGGSVGIGNMSLSQNKNPLTPTSVLATDFHIGTQITRVLDFQISLTSLKVDDDLVQSRLYNNGENSPTGPRPAHLDSGNRVPTHETLAISDASFDLRFVITPRYAFKFYAGLGYTYLSIHSTQLFQRVIDTAQTLSPTVESLDATFKRGAISLLFGIRYDIELGNSFILTPYAEISALGAFQGETQKAAFVFKADPDQITMTHLSLGVTLYFGWFGVERYK